MLVVFLALATLAISGSMLKAPIVERWQIWRLGREADFVTRFRLAQRLGEKRSLRAVPELVRLLQDSDGHDKEAREVSGARVTGAGFVAAILSDLGPPGLHALGQALEETQTEKKHWRRAAMSVLAAAEPPAVEPLVDRVDDEFLCVRLVAIRTLGEVGDEARCAIPALRAALNDPHKYAAGAAEEALKKIEKPR